MLTSSVFLETSIPNIPSFTVLSFHLVCLRELRFEQPCTQDLRSRASQDTVQSEQRSLEKRGLIYRTGSFAKGTTEAHRSPRCSANMFTCQAVRNVQGTGISPCPPHRSRRAAFPHRALAGGRARSGERGGCSAAPIRRQATGTGCLVRFCARSIASRLPSLRPSPLPSTPSAAAHRGLVRALHQYYEARPTPRLPAAARDRHSDCGPDEVSQVPTRSFRA